MTDEGDFYGFCLEGLWVAEVFCQLLLDLMSEADPHCGDVTLSSALIATTDGNVNLFFEISFDFDPDFFHIKPTCSKAMD